MMPVYDTNWTPAPGVGPPVPVPKGAGNYWTPVPHGEMADAVRAESLGVVCAELPPPEQPDAALWFYFPRDDGGPTPALCVVNSNSQKRRMQFFYGLCDKSNPVVLRREAGKKHSYGLNVREEARRAVLEMRGLYRAMHSDRQRLERRRVSDDELARLFLDAGRRGLMPWSRLRDVDRGFSASEKGTAWDLLAAFCREARRSPPLQQPFHMHNFYLLLERK